MKEDFFKIELKGNVFKKAYLVYIVEITSNNYGKYFYIGQTGDRNYPTARPAFRRLAGHFSDQGYSTENQIYRQIAVKILGFESAKEKKTFTEEVKEAVSEFIINSKIEMHVFPIAKFSSNITPDKHKEKRRFTEKIENELINHLIKTFGTEKILNKKHTPVQYDTFDSITNNIINHLHRN